MPSRSTSRGRGRKKVDKKTRSLSRSRKKEEPFKEKMLAVSNVSAKHKGGQEDSNKSVMPIRSRSRQCKKADEKLCDLTRSQNKKEEQSDLAGNVVTSTVPTLMKEYVEENHVIVYRTRSQSVSMDRDAIEEISIKTPKSGNAERRGRKMKRRCQTTVTSMSPFCEKKQSGKLDVRTNTIDDKSFTLVELEDISSLLQSDPGKMPVRSVSLTRLSAAAKPSLQSDMEENLNRRNARSLSRGRNKTVKETHNKFSSKSVMEIQKRKPQSSGMVDQSQKTTVSSDTTEVNNKYLSQATLRKSQDKVNLVDTDNKFQNSWIQSMDVQSSDVTSDEEFSASDDEEIKIPTFVCRCCDDEFTSRFNLHEHLVNFHKITKSTAVLPPSPVTAPSSADKVCRIKKTKKKSVSFGGSDVESISDIQRNVAYMAVKSNNHKNKETDFRSSERKNVNLLFKAFKLKELSVPVERLKKSELSNNNKNIENITKTETLGVSVKGTVEIGPYLEEDTFCSEACIVMKNKQNGEEIPVQPLSDQLTIGENSPTSSCNDAITKEIINSSPQIKNKHQEYHRKKRPLDNQDIKADNKHSRQEKVTVQKCHEKSKQFDSSSSTTISEQINGEKNYNIKQNCNYKKVPQENHDNIQNTEKIEAIVADSFKDGEIKNYVVNKDINDNEQVSLTGVTVEELIQNDSISQAIASIAPPGEENSNCQRHSEILNDSTGVTKKRQFETVCADSVPASMNISKCNKPIQVNENKSIDENIFLREFIEKEQIRVDFGANENTDDSLNVNVDSKALLTELEKGYDEELELVEMFYLIQELGLDRYRYDHSTNSIRYSENESEGNSITDFETTPGDDSQETTLSNIDQENMKERQNLSADLDSNVEDNKNKYCKAACLIQEQLSINNEDSSDLKNHAVDISSDECDSVNYNSTERQDDKHLRKCRKLEKEDSIHRSNGKVLKEDQIYCSNMENPSDPSHEGPLAYDQKFDRMLNKSVATTANSINSVHITDKHPEIKKKIPVIKLKKIPFMNKIEVNGLRLKFKGTQTKPYWKIKNCHSDASQETCNALDENPEKMDRSYQDKHTDLLDHDRTWNDKEILQNPSTREKKNLKKTKTKNHELEKETLLTEFDKALLNSGKLRKEKLKLTKKPNSVVRQKSPDNSGSAIESNRDILFGKPSRHKAVREDNIPLLLKSKIAQKIVDKDRKEKCSRDEEIPDFPPVTNLDSISLPPLSLSKTTANNNVNNSPGKPTQTKRPIRPLSDLKKSLESLGSVKNLIQGNHKATRLKDILFDNVLTDLKNPFETTSTDGMFNSFDPLSKHNKTWNGTNLFKTVDNPLHFNNLFKESNIFHKDNQKDTFTEDLIPKQENVLEKSRENSLNAKLRLEKSNFLTDSAFTKPNNFESSLLSPVPKLCSSDKMPAIPFSSTPAISCRKRSYSVVANVDSDDATTEKQLQFEPVSLFPQLSGSKSNENIDTGSDETNEEITSENSEDMEIISAHASGILTSNSSWKLSDTQVQEAFDWFQNKQTKEPGKVTEKNVSLSTSILNHDDSSKTPAPRVKLKLKRLDITTDCENKVPKKVTKHQNENITNFSVPGVSVETPVARKNHSDATKPPAQHESDNEMNSGISDHKDNLAPDTLFKSKPGFTCEILTSFSSTSHYVTLDETGFQVDRDEHKGQRSNNSNEVTSKTTDETELSETISTGVETEDLVAGANMKDDTRDKNDDDTLEKGTSPPDEPSIDSDDEVDRGSGSGMEQDDEVDSGSASGMEEDDDEKIDILSLYASDDASFLDDDEEDAHVRGKRSESPEEEQTATAGVVSRTGSGSEESEIVDMDIEMVSSPSHSPDAQIEVNVVQNIPFAKQMMKDMVPTGYCYYFHTSGTCKNGNSCRFKHDQPSKENMVKHWRQKMEQYLRKGETEKALVLFEQVATEDHVSPQLVRQMFAQCRQTGHVKCFSLIKYMFKEQFLTVDVINQYIYMCGNNPKDSVGNLWEVFQRMVSLNIQPNNDAMFILLRAFSDNRAWEWLWQVMLYCNETENFNLPVYCLEKALRAMLNDPSRYFNYAVQWLFNSRVEKLQKLDGQLLQEVYKLCQQSGETKLSEGMKTVLMSNRMTPRPRTPMTPFQDGEEVEEEVEDDETVRGWMNRFHGLQYSKNWDYLGELYVERSTIRCPIPEMYIKKIIEILKTNEDMDEVFADFLACAFKRYETESAHNETTRLDMKGLAAIGNSLLVLYAEKQQWQAGYHILGHMVNYNIEYLKYCGATPKVAMVAMEICLQYIQPESALQILKETHKSVIESSKIMFIRRLFPGLFQQLFSKYKFPDCVFVLSVAFRLIFREPHQQESSMITSIKDCTCGLLKECLAQGDVPVAVKVFQLWKEYQSPFVIEILLSRSLLVACLDMRYTDVAHDAFELMKRANVYPTQRIEKPRVLILPMWMTSQEMFLVIEDYLKWLYNSLCNMVLENVRLSHGDLQLSIRFTGILAPNNQQVPFLHGVAQSPAHTQKMVVDVLGQMVPGIGAVIQTDGSVLVEPRSLEGWLCQTDKNKRRQGLRFLQMTGMIAKPRPRSGFHRIPRHR